MMHFFIHGLRKMAVLLLALGAGLVAAWAVREHVRQRVETLEAASDEPRVSRLVAAHDLPAGTMLETSHLAVRDIPAQWAPAASLDPLGIDDILGTRLQADLAQGELVLKACLVSSGAAPKPSLASRLEPGQRAFVVAAADLGGLAGLLRAGDAIDIYVSLPHQGREVTAPLLQGARVLTAADDPDGDGSARITLAASPDQVVRYVTARQRGTLTALLRNRDDPQAVTMAPTGDDVMSLIGPDRQPRRAPGVAILYGDRLADPAGMQGAALTDFESEHP